MNTTSSTTSLAHSTPEFVVREAQIADAGVIASQRARMFEEMGEARGAQIELLRLESTRWTEAAMAAHEYIGWVAAPSHEPHEIVAGAGIHLRNVAPHPANGGVAAGKHGVIINVFTEPAWRRRGLAEQLIVHAIAWARRHQLDRLVLHASEAGRGLYERLGFVATNEMRYELLHE